MLDPLAVFLGNAIAERGLIPIPLVSTDHEVALAAGLAVVTTHRLFRNSESANIEAVLTFPVPVHATLFDLTAEIEGRELHAKAQARSQAREVYEDAVTRGKSAVLHEELLKGIHMISVANIAPGVEIKVTTKWAMPLSVIGGQACLRIPQTLGDVYGRSGLLDADGLVTGGPAQPVMVSIKSEEQVEVLGALLADGCVAVSSAEPIDLVVSLWKPIPIIGHDAAGRGVSLTLTPQSAGEIALNLAVLVDHSGSMASAVGSPGSLSAHEAARNGVANLANELAQGDSIDLWEFDTQFRQVGLIEAEASDLATASNSLVSLAARLSPPSGGTEIGGALKAVIQSSDAKDILLLTDGLSHRLDIDELARCGRRISVILIGADSLEARIGHLAALTGGDLFIATAEDLAEVMMAAIDALRRPVIALPTVTDMPDELLCLRNNVEIRANWTLASDVAAPSDISKAATAVGASLVVNCAIPEFAAQYAVSEGIVSHLTSLVLVDEIGTAQSELPTMRKVALPATSSAMRLSAASYDGGAFFDLSHSSMINESVDILNQSTKSLRSGSPKRERSIRGAIRSMSSLAPARQGPHEIVRLIDWGDDPERLMRGDISLLHPEAQGLIHKLMGDDQLRRLSGRYRMSLEIVAIAILANFASGEDRRAGRIWSAVFNRLCGDIANEIRRDFLEPLQRFFAEIEGRLSGLVGELARSEDNNIGEALTEVASKTQSRCLTIIREHAAGSENRLEELVQARVAEAEQEFFQASRALKEA